MNGPQCIECGGFDECNHGTDLPHQPGPDCGCVDCEAAEAHDVLTHERAHAPGVAS